MAYKILSVNAELLIVNMISSNNALFNDEWILNISKFQSVVNFKSFNIDLKDFANQEFISTHEYMPGIYKEWQTIESSWDRQSLLFSVIYSLVGQYLKPWQIANYLIEDRRAFEAFDLLQSTTSENLGKDYPQHCVSLAKSLLSLTYYEESLKWAKKAYETDKNNTIFKTILADAYFLSGSTYEASVIYKSRLALTSTSESDSIAKMFLEVFAIGTGVLPSPVFAIHIAQQLSDVRKLENFWNLAELEFYYSPYFRANYAYSLLAKGKENKCLSKLIVLVEEMPWLKEASLNLRLLFEHFNQSGNQVMPEFQEKLTAKINHHQWTDEGMFILEI
jgi:tetratricopeptide (TPR) repeat protein